MRGLLRSHLYAVPPPSLEEVPSSWGALDGDSDYTLLPEAEWWGEGPQGVNYLVAPTKLPHPVTQTIALVHRVLPSVSSELTVLHASPTSSVMEGRFIQSCSVCLLPFRGLL